MIGAPNRLTATLSREVGLPSGVSHSERASDCPPMEEPQEPGPIALGDGIYGQSDRKTHRIRNHRAVT